MGDEPLGRDSLSQLGRNSPPLELDPLMQLLDLHLDADPVPLPEKGDRLIVVPSQPEDFQDPRRLACLKQFPPDWTSGLYAEGYSRAASIIVNWVLATGTCADVLVLPVVFLFRQYLEVVLKALIESAEAALGMQPRIRSTHDLAVLWREVRRLVLVGVPARPS